MKKVVTFGEIMLRLAPEGYLRFFQADKFEATYGGGEANVAVSLANYGLDVSFVTKLPKHEIGQATVNSLRKYGVDTSKIVRGGDRVGIYFLEKGASQRPSKVIYDRFNSAISKAKREDFDWNNILDGADFFHFTGITPALGGEVPAICEDALKVCKEKGITVSCDINYRKNLWTVEEAKVVLKKLMPYVNVCITNDKDVASLFDIHTTIDDIASGKLDKERYKDVAKQFSDKYGFDKVVFTLRGSISANDNNWAAMIYDGEDFHFSRSYLVHIVDRVGGGDSFAGGLIYALLSDFPMEEAVEFAVAASCLKHTIEGDFNLISVSEAMQLATGDGSGRVQR